MALVAKNFQDIITFSRATQTGTYVNSSGYITNSSVLNYLTYSNQPENAAWTKSNSFVQQNLALYSEQFDNATWIKGSAGVGVPPVVTANQGVAPDGTLTADRVDFNCGALTIADRSYISQPVSVTTGAAYTDAIWIKAFDAATVGKTIRFVLESGGASGTNVFTITDQWQRIVVSGAGAVAASVNVLMETRGTYSSSATASVLIWGAQLVQGSVPGDYRATTSAALPCLYADYNGALRARKLCENTATSSHSTSQSVAVTAGVVYTASVKIKAAERGFAQLRYENGGSTEFFAVNVNLSTGAYTTATFGTPTSTSATVTPDDDGYWKVTVSAAANNTTFVTAVFVQSVLGTNSYTGDGSSGIYIADAQLNDGSSALSYYNTDAYAYNAPRFDYDPVTLAAKGLLIEEQRANLLVRSNDWSLSWTNINITQTAASTLGPDGTVSMTKLAATTAAGTSCSLTAVATATSHTYSIYVKQGTSATAANFFAIYNDTTATALSQFSINYSTGVITHTTGSGATATNVGNGIWRLSVPVTSGITIGNVLRCYVGFVGNTPAAGDFLYAYGAQLEAGAFATSYIPTTGSQVTRAADVPSVNTLSPWFNSVAGTLYVEALHGAIPSAAALAVEIGDGTSNNRHAIFTAGTANSNYYDVVSGVNQATISASAFAANVVGKFAATYAVNDFQVAGNGTLGGSDISGSLPTNLTTMFIGNSIGSTSFWNGHLRRITYYPRRLTNAELQTLTTL